MLLEVFPQSGRLDAASFDSLPYFSVQTYLGITIPVSTIVWFCFITALLFKINIIFLKEGNILLSID